MNSNRNSSIASAIASLALISASQGALITNWNLTSGQNAGFQGETGTTASPVIGDGVTNNHAGASSLYASLNGGAGYTLTNVGDTITLTGAVSFIGHSTSAGSGTFRFGLFDVNGSSNLEAWLGYITHNASGSTTAKIWERGNPNTGAYSSVVESNLGTFERLDGLAPGTAYTGNGVSSFLLSFELLAGGNVKATSQLLNNGTDFASVTDTFLNSNNGSSLVFNRVGFLVTNALSADQASYSNIDVTFTAVPEPTGAALGLIGMGACLFRRRRK
jgi:hypothetical protein